MEQCQVFATRQHATDGGRIPKGGFINEAVRDDAERVIEAFDVKTPSVHRHAAALSGGEPAKVHCRTRNFLPSLAF